MDLTVQKGSALCVLFPKNYKSEARVNERVSVSRAHSKSNLIAHQTGRQGLQMALRDVFLNPVTRLGHSDSVLKATITLSLVENNANVPSRATFLERSSGSFNINGVSCIQGGRSGERSSLAQTKLQNGEGKRTEATVKVVNAAAVAGLRVSLTAAGLMSQTKHIRG